MQKSTDNFFIPNNEVNSPEELDYSRVSEYICSAEFLVRFAKSYVFVRTVAGARKGIGPPVLYQLYAEG